MTPFARQVLDAVDRIPAGRVLTYGDLAEYVGTGNGHAVGAVLARWGAEVPWHRVVTASGRPAAGHVDEALARLRAEGVPMAPDATRVELSRARWDGV